jgi:hypothetical protein
MAETLQLTHTVGRAGWDVAHAGGRSEFALAALGLCFAHRRLMFNLPLLWKLRALWNAGVADLDPRALRLALSVDRRVRVSGAGIDVALTPASGGTKPLAVSLPLVAARAADDRLPPADDGLDWRVLALSADGVKAFRKLARGLAGLPKGTLVELTASAKESKAPAALRRGYPLRVELLLDPAAGWLTLVPQRSIEVEK